MGLDSARLGFMHGRIPGAAAPTAAPAQNGSKQNAMRYVVTIIGLILALGTLAGLKGAQISKLIQFGQAMQAQGPPPEAVSTAVASEQVWQRSLGAVGSVVSAKGVDVSNDAPGVVSRIAFESGDVVKPGQVLVELDAAVERAQLGSIRARTKLAAQSLERSRALIASGVETQSQLDADTSSFDSLSADARALEAQIERKTIRAPFAGRLGMRAINLGQYLPPGTTVASLESTDSVFIDFSLPQQRLDSVKVGMTVRLREQSGREPLAEGVVSAVSPAVDAVTRSVQLRASAPNPEATLRPGMFVNVELLAPGDDRVVVVPTTAVVHASYGDSVFLVVEAKDEAGQPLRGPDGQPRRIAQQQFVRVGSARGDFVVIENGVSAGQELVSAGAFKLRNGAFVAVEKDVSAEPALHPQLDNR
jgi:membrane fusion protein (multidrug efflux system)